MVEKQYEYLPLSEDLSSIRLVRVMAGEVDAQLSCTIDHVFYTEGICYQALSYAWKDSYLEFKTECADSERIIVNDDSYLLVRKNLASFLWHIRGQNGPTEYIWIDAICINQEDIQERNIHVVEMAKVYKRAKHVIVWLGPEQGNSAQAISFIKELWKMESKSSQATAAEASSEISFWSDPIKQQLQEVSGNDDIKNNWIAMVELFKRAWWRRTWIVQEVLLAQDFTFMCGFSSLKWLCLWHTLENLWAHSDWVIKTLPKGRELLDESSPGRTVLWMRSNRHKGDRNLLQLLYHLRPSQASDPKDKIYGVLGLASDASSVVPHANYEWSLAKIYVELFQTMTRMRGDLDWLTLADSITNNAALPSWCPDLTQKARLVSMNTCRSVQAQKPFGFFAAGTSRPIMRIGGSLHECLVEGFVVDEVDGLGAVLNDEKSQSVDNSISQPASTSTAYSTNEEIFAAIWTTLVADQDFEGTENVWRAPSIFGLLYASEGQKALRDHSYDLDSQALSPFFVTWIRQNAGFGIGGKTISEWTALMGTISEDIDIQINHGFYRRLQSTVTGRRLITTSKGYIGMASDTVRRGDQVCLLSGSRMPIILRPIGESFRLIGESYIHGMMFAELWPCKEGHQGKTLQFNLA